MQPGAPVESESCGVLEDRWWWPGIRRFVVVTTFQTTQRCEVVAATSGALEYWRRFLGVEFEAAEMCFCRTLFVEEIHEEVELGAAAGMP